MNDYHIELPARRTAWLADIAYQVRLTEQARMLAAAAKNMRPSQLCLDAAGMPDTVENAQLAEHDEVRVCFTFRVVDRSARPGAQRRKPRRAA